jgi:hypothetical protein
VTSPDTIPWKWLERRSATLFLVGGVLLIPFAASLAAMGLLDVEAPQNLFSGAGLTLAFLGLLGLYPGLADRSRWPARAGAVLATLGAASFLALFVANVAHLAGVVASPSIGPLGALNVVGILLGFPVTGLAVLRSAAHSRTLGLLVSAPGVIFAGNVVRLAVGGPVGAAEVAAVFALAQALTMLGIGYALRTGGIPGDRPEPTADAVA